MRNMGLRGSAALPLFGREELPLCPIFNYRSGSEVAAGLRPAVEDGILPSGANVFGEKISAITGAMQCGVSSTRLEAGFHVSQGWLTLRSEICGLELHREPAADQMAGEFALFLSCDRVVELVLVVAAKID